MSENDVMQKLARSAAEMSDQLTVEQMRLYQAYVTKTLEAREAEEAFLAAAQLESGGDDRMAERIRLIRSLLTDAQVRLSGSEAVMLACRLKHLEQEDRTDTKRVNVLLHSFERKPSNTTKIVDILEKKSLMETQSDGLHAHKTFRLTHAGEDWVDRLLTELDAASGRDRLAVVD